MEFTRNAILELNQIRLKAIYVVFVKLANSSVELWGIDQLLKYTTHDQFEIKVGYRNIDLSHGIQ